MSRAETPRSLGAAIKARRQELGWTQEELAERVIAQGTDAFRQSDVSRLERGKVGLPHRDRLSHIAAALGLSPGELLARSGWAGADRAVTARDPALPSGHRNVAPVVGLPSVSVHTPAIPPHEEFRRMREVLAEARATRAHSRQILDQCEVTRVLYEGLLPPKKQHELTT
jgi:transcriptional regulator with XRE-family HTH domain